MIRPATFRMNEETAIYNFFQKNLEKENTDLLATA